MHTSSILKAKRGKVAGICTPSEVCVQNTITELRMTADLDEVAAFLEAGKAKKLLLNNSARQNYTSGPISIRLCHSKAFKKADEDERSLSYGNHVKRSTYSLEEASRSLDEVMASGKAIMASLASVNSTSIDGKYLSAEPTTIKQAEPSGSGTSTKRGTYDLCEVADIVDKGVREGISLEDSLDGVSGESNGDKRGNGIACPPRIKRNTYDLNDVASKLGECNQQSGVSLELEDLLRELGCEKEDLSDATSSSTRQKRGTYDLDHVSGNLDDSLSSGKCLEDSLEQMSLVDNSHSRKHCDREKRETYNLNDVSSKLDQSVNSSDTLGPNASDHAVYEKRRTYDLSDISNELDKSLNSGRDLEDSLERTSSAGPKGCSSAEIKRRTYDLTDVDLNLLPTNQDMVGKPICNNNTIECDHVPDQQTSGDVVALLTSQKGTGDALVSEKQKTYTLDAVTAIDVSFSNDRPKKPERIFQPDRASSDKASPKELTPGLWMMQMKDLGNSPFKVSAEKIQNGSASGKKNIALDSSGNAMKNDKQQVKGSSGKSSSDPKASPKAHLGSPSSRSSSVRSPGSTLEKRLQHSSALKARSSPRSQSLSGSASTSNLNSTSKRSRSVSSSPNSGLKSSSTPEISPSKDDLLENLKEVSPGVRNYLTNKLGLSDEQCMAVHRRLNSGSQEPSEPPSSEHRKTYSLDDVAHSLDIATSQGLPMTSVLDNLESEPENRSSEEGIECHGNNTVMDERTGQHHSSSSTVEDKGHSSIEQSNVENSASLRRVTLQSTSVKSEFSLNQRTYTLSDGSADGKTSGKDTTTSLDNLCQFRLSTKKTVYKPSAKLHSFSHLLGGKSAQNRLRNSKGMMNETKRNTYTLESVAENIEKAQDAGVSMIDALKRLSGSCADENSGSSAEKRKTYSLEDVSNTLESASASGVPIVEVLQKIANPDGTENGKSIERRTSLRSSKRKAPPKPKRTFSKPEIKFEADSFVIEYHTSPNKSHSTSSEPCDAIVTETANQIDFGDTGKVYGKDKIDGTKVTCVAEGKKGKAELSVITKESWNHNKEAPKQTGTHKAVTDLNDLLVQLAAEVDKTRESTSSDSERSSSQDFTSSSMNLVEESAEDLSKNGEPVFVDCSCPASFESNVDCEDLLSDTSQKTIVKELCDTECKDSVHILLAKTEGESCEESTDVLKSGKSKEAISYEEKAVLVKVAGDCSNLENEVPFLPILDSEICSDVKAGDELDYLHGPGESKSEIKNEVDGDIAVKEQTSGTEEISSSDDLENTTDEEPLDVADDLNENDIRVDPVESGTQLVDTSEGSGQSANKSDSLVSRDLNLLRLKLAEKQRRIEAQKQRTKEQQEEERKRFGENVFWFAVGKDRERKDSNGINSPNETRVQKKIEPPPSSISEKTLDSSDVEPSTNEKFATFTKQSSLDELPPSMGKLQDRTYSLPTVSKGLTTDTSELLLPNQVTRNPETFVMPAMQSLSNRNLSEEVVHEFRLSRQTSGSQDLLLNKVQTTAKPEALGNSGDLPTHSGDFPTHSGRVPVMNYKSIISVPLTYTAQPVSPNFADGSGNSANLAHAPVGVADGFSNQASSPTRKCWDVESTSNDEPEMAVSKSNYYMFENGNVDGGRTDNSKNGGDSSGNGQDARWTSNGGTTDIGKQRQESPGNHQDTRWANEGATDNSENRHGMSRNCREERQGTSGNHHDARWTNGGTTDNRQGTIGSDQDTRWINQQVYKGGQNIDLRKDAPNEISERLDDQNEFKKAPSSEKMSIDENSGTFERHPESPRSFEEINGNSPVSENDNDTPKKGLSLFIGDQNAVGEDGLTPEQLKKREKFLKNRQMKIEEEKLKRGAIMEKKRRKEEKMKEIQFRREKEELSRHERLQEKKQQAENAKQERQKYELQRKENLQGRTMMDGVPGGYTGFSRTEMIPHGHSVVGGGMISAGMNNGSSFTSPSSAFSGFTGVQSYVRPSGKTNRKLTINAISHVCLPGAVNKETKDKCLQAMTESSAQHFLILFREGLKFRGLYSLDPESNQVLKVHGVGPRSITEKMIQRLYKYNSGGKEFSEIPTKSFSISVDGFTLQKSCWQSHKPSVSSKTVSNYKVSPYRTR